MTLGRIWGALFKSGGRAPQTCPPMSAPETLPLSKGTEKPTQQPFEVVLREDDPIGGYADTSAFIGWCQERLPDASCLPWSRLWGLYHEYCMLFRMRPRSQRKLQQELGPLGVEKPRPVRNGKRITVYTLPQQSMEPQRRVA